jgi:hypothetical protein
MERRKENETAESNHEALYVTKEQIMQEARRDPPAPAWPFPWLSDCAEDPTIGSAPESHAVEKRSN